MKQSMCYLLWIMWGYRIALMGVSMQFYHTHSKWTVRSATVCVPPALAWVITYSIMRYTLRCNCYGVKGSKLSVQCHWQSFFTVCKRRKRRLSHTNMLSEWYLNNASSNTLVEMFTKRHNAKLEHQFYSRHPQNGQRIPYTSWQANSKYNTYILMKFAFCRGGRFCTQLRL